MLKMTTYLNFNRLLLYVSSEEIPKSLLERKETSVVVNLCYNADEIVERPEKLGEINMCYIRDLSEFHKEVRIVNKTVAGPTQDAELKRTVTLGKTYICDRCFKLWSCKRTDRFKKHATSK